MNFRIILGWLSAAALVLSAMAFLGGRFTEGLWTLILAVSLGAAGFLVNRNRTADMLEAPRSIDPSALPGQEATGENPPHVEPVEREERPRP